jgi:hypothetical protein
MTLAKAAAKLISSNLRYPCGARRVRDRRHLHRRRGRGRRACADKFARENVGVTLTVTPCWCYGSETMDMDPCIPKAIWGFNGTERPARCTWRRAGRPQPEGPARLQHLRPRRAGRRRLRHPAGCEGEDPAASPAPASPWPPCAASPTSAWAASPWASPAPSSTSRCLRGVPRHARRDHRHDRVHPPHGQGHL